MRNKNIFFILAMLSVLVLGSLAANAVLNSTITLGSPRDGTNQNGTLVFNVTAQSYLGFNATNVSIYYQCTADSSNWNLINRSSSPVTSNKTAWNVNWSTPNNLADCRLRFNVTVTFSNDTYSNDNSTVNATSILNNTALTGSNITLVTPTTAARNVNKSVNNQVFTVSTTEEVNDCYLTFNGNSYNMTYNGSRTGFTYTVNSIPFGIYNWNAGCFDLAGATLRTSSTSTINYEHDKGGGTGGVVGGSSTPTTGKPNLLLVGLIVVGAYLLLRKK